jgi:P27 family predicted phage terminase small subunit
VIIVRGRKPKPTALHVINGNPSRKDLDKQIKNEPNPQKIAPECPAWLKPEAIKVWNKFYPELERLGLLTIVDEIAFASLCQSYATYIEMEKMLEKEGRTVRSRTGAVKTRPEVHIANNALGFIKAFAVEFGLTPSSRGRISLPSNNDLDDEFEKLINE